MPHEYRQPGEERYRRAPRKSRSDERELGRYGARDDRSDSNAPPEWDSRRYGRDFNDDPNDGGRGVYGSGTLGRYDFEDSGAYRRGATRQESPYGEQSTYQRLGEEEYGGGLYENSDPNLTGANWERTTGSGEWYTDASRAGEQRYAYDRPASEAYGRYGSRDREPGRGFSEQGAAERSFRGRGPKGYQRSDERLKEIICEALTDAPHIDASNIAVEVRNGEVTLSGEVENRRAKHAAEDLIEHRAGVNEIRNDLRVRGGASGWRQDSQQERPGISRGATQGGTFTQGGSATQGGAMQSGVKSDSDRKSVAGGKTDASKSGQ